MFLKIFTKNVFFFGNFKNKKFSIFWNMLKFFAKNAIFFGNFQNKKYTFLISKKCFFFGNFLYKKMLFFFFFDRNLLFRGFHPLSLTIPFTCWIDVSYFRRFRDADPRICHVLQVDLVPWELS